MVDTPPWSAGGFPFHGGYVRLASEAGWKAKWDRADIFRFRFRHAWLSTWSSWFATGFRGDTPNVYSSVLVNAQHCILSAGSSAFLISLSLSLNFGHRSCRGGDSLDSKPNSLRFAIAKFAPFFCFFFAGVVLAYLAKTQRGFLFFPGQARNMVLLSPTINLHRTLSPVSRKFVRYCSISRSVDSHEGYIYRVARTSSPENVRRVFPGRVIPSRRYGVMECFFRLHDLRR